MPAAALLSVLGACVLWAVSFVATKVALAAAPPLTVVTLRLAVAALTFGVLAAVAPSASLRAALRRPVAVFGLSLMGTSLHFASQTAGLQFTTASNASLYAATGPLTIAALGALFLGERLTLRKAAGILIALTGVVCVMGSGGWQSLDLAKHVLGDLLVLASIVMWGVFTVFGKRLTDELGALTVTAAVTVMGALTILPFGIVESRVHGFGLGQMTAPAWAAVLFLGIGCSFLATLLYFVALERSESQKVGVFLYTIPPMTALVAHLGLGELLSSGFFVGSAMVLGGVYLTERG